MGKVLDLSNKLKLIPHPKLGARVKINIPWTRRMFFYSRGENKHNGKEGCVTDVTIGEHCKLPIFSVMFGGDKDWKDVEMGCYFKEDLEFKTLGIFEKKDEAA